MHLLAISLLTILAGILLLAKFKKEDLGKFFSYAAWFFIVVGFLLFAGFIAGGVCKATHHGNWWQPNCNYEMMMKNCNHDMMGDKDCPKGMDKMECHKDMDSRHHCNMRENCPKHIVGDSLQAPMAEDDESQE